MADNRKMVMVLRLDEADMKALLAIVDTLWLARKTDGIVQSIRIASLILKRSSEAHARHHRETGGVYADGYPLPMRLTQREYAHLEGLRKAIGTDGLSDAARIAIRMTHAETRK